MFDLRGFVSDMGRKAGNAWNGTNDQNQQVNGGIKGAISQGAQTLASMSSTAFNNSKPVVSAMAQSTANTIKQGTPIVTGAIGKTAGMATDAVKANAPTVGKMIAGGVKNVGSTLRGLVDDYVQSKQPLIDPRSPNQIAIDSGKIGPVKVDALKTVTPTQQTAVVTKTLPPTTLSTPVKKAIDLAFGEYAPEAHSVLSRMEGSKKVGENVGYGYGKDMDVANRIDPKTGKWDNNAPVKQIKNSVTGETMPSIDRGLFRINNGTFFDFMARHPDAMARNGITNWDDMLDPEKNALMARLIFNRQGWGGWYAAPEDLRKRGKPVKK